MEVLAERGREGGRAGEVLMLRMGPTVWEQWEVEVFQLESWRMAVCLAAGGARHSEARAAQRARAAVEV